MAQTLANDGSTNLNSTGSGIKLRANSSGVPMSHDDVDTNFENLRLKVNEVIGEVGTNTSKLSGIATGANNYSLPLATSTVRGGIELFSNTDQSVAANSVSTTASRTYGIQLNSANQAVVNVPWSNTTYGAASSTGLGLSKIGSSTQQNIAANSVTSIASRTYAVQHNSADQLVVNVPWSNTNTTYSTATSSTAGLVKIGYTETGNKYPVELSSGKMFVEVPWTDTDTNTTYTAGTGISISGTTISATGGVGGSGADAQTLEPLMLSFYINATTGTTNFTTARTLTTNATNNSQIVSGKFANWGTVEQYIATHMDNRPISIYAVFETDVTETLTSVTQGQEHTFHKIELVGSGNGTQSRGYTKWDVAVNRTYGIIECRCPLTIRDFQITATTTGCNHLFAVHNRYMLLGGYIGFRSTANIFGDGIFAVYQGAVCYAAVGATDTKGWDFWVDGSHADVYPQSIFKAQNGASIQVFLGKGSYTSGLGKIDPGNTNNIGSGGYADTDVPRIVCAGNLRAATLTHGSSLTIDTNGWPGTYYKSAAITGSGSNSGNNFGPFARNNLVAQPTDYAPGSGPREAAAVYFRGVNNTLGIHGTFDASNIDGVSQINHGGGYQQGIRFTTLPGHVLAAYENHNTLATEVGGNLEEYINNLIELPTIAGDKLPEADGIHTDTTDATGALRATASFRGYASLQTTSLAVDSSTLSNAGFYEAF